LLCFEQIRRERVSYYAQKQINYRPNENATYRARLDNADTSAANDANCRKGSEDAATEAGNNKDRSGPCRESENNAAELLAETAGHSEGPTAEKIELCLISGVDLLIEIAKVRQSFHRQAVFVFFALQVHFHQMLGQAVSGASRLGTVCKSAVYGQRAING
jgi:hypothetical protein